MLFLCCIFARWFNFFASFVLIIEVRLKPFYFVEKCFRLWIDWAMLMQLLMILSMNCYFSLSFIASEVQNVFIYVQVFNSVFMVGCSYKFEFPTPDDRPGAPIISFR